jgi:hypothetical protein
MKTLSLKFRTGVTASRKKIIADHYQDLVKKRNNNFDNIFRPLLQLAKQVNKELKPLVTRQDTKEVLSLKQQTKLEISKSLLRDLNPLVNDIEKSKTIRNKFKGAFRKTVKNYTAILNIKNKFNTESGRALCLNHPMNLVRPMMNMQDLQVKACR